MALGDDIAKGFYSYLLIKDGYGTIATIFDKKDATDSEKFLYNTIDFFSQYTNKEEIESGIKFGGYRYFNICKSLCT
ncbi:hypothetical protein [Methanolobus sp.]|jgi:hypothetical protein|uniref:hypothetical protein n=1 Tax=Methanolobus sp. TaxID=1874737 RepID=UPI0025D6687E|nr:hypothetical protein [Methanolobus sp.]